MSSILYRGQGPDASNDPLTTSFLGPLRFPSPGAREEGKRRGAGTRLIRLFFLPETKANRSPQLVNAAFYTRVRVLYPVRSPQSVFYIDRMLKAQESSLLLRVLGGKTLIHCQPATSPSTHQLRYLGDLSSDSLCENNSRAALLVSNIALFSRWQNNLLSSVIWCPVSIKHGLRTTDWV